MTTFKRIKKCMFTQNYFLNVVKKSIILDGQTILSSFFVTAYIQTTVTSTFHCSVVHLSIMSSNFTV